MKNFKKKQYAGLLLLLLTFQLISLSVSSLGISGSKANMEKPEIEKPESSANLEKSGESHSSPFRFPINRSSPLMTEEMNDSLNNGNNPKSSDYYDFRDFALTINLDKSAVSTGDQIKMRFTLLRNLTAASGETITVKIYNGFFRNYYYWYDNFYDVSVPIFETQIYTDIKGQASLDFVNTSQEGLYTIYAYANGYESYKGFMVGNAGIFCKGPLYYDSNQEYKAAIQLVDLSDFSPISYANISYSFSYYDYNNNNWDEFSGNQIQTDEYGYVIINSIIPEENEDSYYYFYNSIKFTIESIENNTKFTTFIYKSWDYYYYSLWNGEQKANQDPIQYIVTTDKTIYNPGETIHIRALVLEYSFMGESRLALKNIPVNLTIINPSELAFFWTTISTDNNGVLKFDIPLDNDCELGSYGIDFEINGNKYRYNIKVEHYTKPVFRVSINTNGKDFYPENSGLFAKKTLFEGTVDVFYYFGQPVVDASVNLYIKDYSGQVKLEVSGKTNGEGQFYFSINLDSIKNLEYSFSAQADVIDTYGREADTERFFSRFNEIYAYGYLSNWAPKPSETLEYYFYVYQFLAKSNDYSWWDYEFNPLVNVTAKIEIYGVKEYPLFITTIDDEDLLQTYYKTTNIYGGGNLEINLPLDQVISYNFFEIHLTINLPDGRQAESSTYFRYKKYSLEINIQTETVNQGDTLKFSASYKDALSGEDRLGEGRFYIYQSDHQLLGQATIILNGTQNFEVPISDYSPDGKYFIYSYVYSRSNQFFGGFYYNWDHKTFEVGTSKSITITSNITTSETKYSNKVSIGDSVNIIGNTDVSTNIPVYLEIYKRGLVDSVQMNVDGDGYFFYNLSVSGEYGPDFTVMVYTISDTGKLYEDYLIFHVNYKSGFTLSTDKEIYEPGDDITLTITPEGNTTTLFSISFIDSSVLDVEPEDDSELAYFTMNSYGAYISSSSSWGSGFDARSYFWIDYDYKTGGVWSYYLTRDYAEGYDLAMNENSAERGSEQSSMEPPTFDNLLTNFNTDIRKNISESANWISSMIISEPVNLTFHLPDNIGEWTIRTVGNGLDDEGFVYWGEVKSIQIKTFLPFFIEFDIPEPVIQDDILTIKGYIYNYIGKDISANVAIDTSGCTVLNREVQELFIPDGFVSEVEFSVYCSEPFMQNITLLAATNVSGTLYSDAKQLSVYIEPNGIKIVNRTVGFLNASDESVVLNYSLDPMAIYHKENLAIYADLMDVSIESWNSLIGYPYGCVEQTISKLFPT
ncbi:MAG: MG2 domain-containing protein, partial [Promethearchaeota archaeon]